MNSKNYRSIWRNSFFLIAGVLLVMTGLFLGKSYARFQEKQSLEMTLKGSAQKAEVYFRSTEKGSYAEAGSWEKDPDAEGGYTLDFLLSNASGKNAYAERTQQVTLQVVATTADYADTGENTEITLTADGQTYTGRGESIGQDTRLWKQYGDGRVYRFYNEAGEEVRWTLTGGRESNRVMNLQVKNGRAGAAYVLMTNRVETE